MTIDEPTLEAGITARRGPMGSDARVPENSRRADEVELARRIGEQDGAAVESECHGHVS
jgi:hypothetical protein